MEELDICRLCLSENVDMYDINDCISEDNLTYSELAKQIANLQDVDKVPDVSRLICGNCSEFCQEILKFRYMIITSNEFLLEKIRYNQTTGTRPEESQDETEEPIEIYVENNEREEIIEEALIETDYNVASDGSDYEKPIKIEKPKNIKSPKRKYKKKGSFECETCQKNFLTENLLERHDVLHSNLFIQMENNFDDINRCIVCNLTCQSQGELKEHIKHHKKKLKDELVIDCQYCEKSHCNYSNLIRHLKTHEENKTLKCIECGKKFAPGSQELIDHLNMHKGFAPHICEVCGKAFMRRHRLMNHQKTHSTVEENTAEFLCTECGKVFKSATNLKYHQKTHNNERSFSCSLCFSKFFHKGNLKAHMTSVHSNERPFKCELCGSSFSLSYVLKNHLNRVHGRQRKYSCEFCQRAFATSDHLRRHLRTHTGEKPYSCEYCGKNFTQNGDLNKHRRIHVGECTYKCEQPGCDKAFRLIKELRNHYQEHL